MFTIESIYDSLKSKFSELQNIDKESIVKLGVLDTLFKVLAFVLNSIIKHIEYLFLNTFVRTTNSLYFAIQKAIEFKYFPKYKIPNKGYVIFFPNDLPNSYEDALQYNFKIYSKNRKSFLYMKCFHKNYPYVCNTDYILNRDICFGAAALATDFESNNSNFDEPISTIKILSFNTLAECYIKVKDPLFDYIIQNNSTIYFIGSIYFTNVYQIVQINYITNTIINNETYKIYKILFQIPFEEFTFVKTEKVSIYKTFVLFNTFKLQILNGDLIYQNITINGIQNEEIDLPIENLSLDIFDLYYNGIKLNRYEYEIDEYIKDLDFPYNVGYSIFPYYTFKGIKIKFSNGVYSEILPNNSNLDLYYLVIDENRNFPISNLYEKFDIADPDLVDYNFYNISYIIGYKDFENLNELKNNILFSYNKVLFSESQYEYFLKTIPFISKAKIYKENYVDFNLNSLLITNYYIIVVPKSPIPTLSVIQIIYILQQLDKYKSLQDTFLISLPYLIFPDLKIGLKLKNNVYFDQIKSKVFDSLSKAFYFENSELGKSYYESTLNKIILDSSDLIDYIYLDVKAKFVLFDFNSSNYVKELKFFTKKDVLLDLNTFELFLVIKKDFIFYPPIRIAHISNQNNLAIFNSNTGTTIYLNPDVNNIFSNINSNYLQYDPTSNSILKLNLDINLNYQHFTNWYKLSQLQYFPMSGSIQNGFFFYIRFKFQKAVLDQSNNIDHFILNNDLLTINESIFVSSYFNSFDFDIYEL